MQRVASPSYPVWTEHQMEHSLQAMTVALRVLTALNEKRNPDAADVTELRRFVQAPPGQPLDELACDAIRLALQWRALRRSKSQSV